MYRWVYCIRTWQAHIYVIDMCRLVFMWQSNAIICIWNTSWYCRHVLGGGGGVSIYCDSKLSAYQLANLSFVTESIEVCVVRLKILSRVVIIVASCLSSTEWISWFLWVFIIYFEWFLFSQLWNNFDWGYQH